jgi:two-component system, HptB-dependent secretion and biofilm response regulator
MPEQSAVSLKILIADDSGSDRLILKSIVEKQGHIPLLAVNGLEAVETFRREKPDIILLDALMPEMDGFEAARQIKQLSGDHFIPIIFLTSLNEADSLAKCLEVGGDDFLSKPYNSIILKAKINAFWRMLKMHVTLQQQRDEIAEHNKRLVHEQEVAKLTFDKIAHEGSLSAGNIRYRLSPMAIFNGDVLLAAMRPNGNLCVLLGDFTGHGLAAAIGAMPLSQTFYSMVAKGFTIQDILTELNSKLKEILPVGVFCCAVLLDMDFRSKRLELWSGGMPESYLYHQASKQLQLIRSEHLALGILPPEKFSAKTRYFDMQNGDRLFLWSDGILEAESSQGERFGSERLHAIFQQDIAADQFFTVANDAINQFIKGNKRSDDLSIAEITMVDVDLDQQLVLSQKPYPFVPGEWNLSFELHPSSLRMINPIPLLQKVLTDLPGLQHYAVELFTVFTELYSNALEHGVLGLKSELKSSADGFAEYYAKRHDDLQALEQGFIRFELSYFAKDEKSALEVLVTDSGAGFDYEKVAKQTVGANSYSGRGLKLIHAICSSVEYLGVGNQVRIIFEW